MINKPKMEIDISGPDGNIYVILGKASQIMRKLRRINDFNELRDKVFASHSYSEALNHVNEYITLIDTSDKQILKKAMRGA